MTRDDVEVLEEDVGYQGIFRVDRYRLRHCLYAGGWSAPMAREVFERGHAVAVIPFDPVRDRLVLIEQFRAGAFAAARTPWFAEDFSPWLLEVVAGIIDEGETPEQVAKRETLEEIGCTVHDLVPVCRTLASPGACSESVAIFCGRIDADEATAFAGMVHEHEDIRVLVVSPEEAFQWLDQGRIVNATTLVALHWFRTHHPHLRESWG
ncbi:MAG: NUDIX domain-containing protein [Rhodospirillales bacterium]|nr:MAG: NUDIX domain-containing protein [Rhodospirillales bacterium]